MNSISVKFVFNDEIRRISIENSSTYEEVVSVIRKLFKNAPASFALKYEDEDEELITLNSEIEFREALNQNITRFEIVDTSATEETEDEEDDDEDDDFPIDILLQQLLESSLFRPQSQSFPFFGRQFGPCQRSNQFPPTRPQCSPCGPRAFCPRFNAQAPSAFSIPIRFANQQENTTKSPEPKTTTNPNNNNNSEVIHYGIVCDGCDARPIRGLRFKCNTCPDFDLCEKCTTQNLHKEHQFTKITEPSRFGLPFFLRRFNELAQQNSQKSETTNTTTNTNDSEKLPTETSKQIPESKQEDSEKVPEEKKTEENSEKNEQEELTPFEQKLKKLQDMGFNNRDENIRLLVNNRGDIVRTVAQLLN